MEFNEYKVLAMRTNPKDKTQIENLVNACLGLVGEYAELKNCTTRESLRDELSDIYWYTALLHVAIGNHSVDVHTDLQLIECIGAISDDVKKHAFQGHELNVPLMRVYANKLLYTINKAAKMYGFNPSEVMEYNIKKLQRRYPEGFEVDKSVNREE